MEKDARNLAKRCRRRCGFGGRSDVGGAESDGGRKELWISQRNGSTVGRDLSEGGIGRVERKAKRKAAGRKVSRVASSSDSQHDSGSVSESAEDAVCAVDAGGGGGMDREEVWDLAFGVDGGEVFAAVGFSRRSH